MIFMNAKHTSTEIKMTVDIKHNMHVGFSEL
jgi:hypothetical protein